MEIQYDLIIKSTEIGTQEVKICFNKRERFSLKVPRHQEVVRIWIISQLDVFHDHVADGDKDFDDENILKKLGIFWKAGRYFSMLKVQIKIGPFK